MDQPSEPTVQYPRPQPPPPPKQGLSPLLAWIFLIIVIVLLWGMFVPTHNDLHSAKKAVCISNQKQLALSLIMYSTDNNDYLPENEWADRIMPNLHDPQSNLTCPESTYGNSYGLNSNVVGLSIAAMALPADVVSTFEADGGNVNYIGGEDDLVYRHSKGACFGYTDGHAKFFRDKIHPSFDVELLSKTDMEEQEKQ